MEGEGAESRLGTRNVGEMRAAVFLACALTTMRKWPWAMKLSSEIPPPALCPQNSGTRNLYLSYKSFSSRANCMQVLRMLWLCVWEEKRIVGPSLLLFHCPALGGPGLRLSVCASVGGGEWALYVQGSKALLWLLLQTQLPVTGLAASICFKIASHQYWAGRCPSRQASRTALGSGGPWSLGRPGAHVPGSTPQGHRAPTGRLPTWKLCAAVERRWAGYVTLNQLFDLPVPQFPRQKNGESRITTSMALL